MNLKIQENNKENKALDLKHKLVTNEIEADIRETVKRTSRTPSYTIVVYENEPPALSKWDEVVITEQRPSFRDYRFCPFKVKEDEVNDFLHWFSGVIFGALIEHKDKEKK